MEKKFQVFVSSTYIDLVQERDEVMKALLELNCIPNGMELFPSSDDTALKYIKKVIDNCDYFISIVGGMYGSLDSNGISYSQLEYEYACSQNIPTISFLIKSPENLPANKYELDPEKRKKLNEFRIKLELKLCRYWNNKEDLCALLSRSVLNLIKENPRSGWVRHSENLQTDLQNQIFDKLKESEKRIQMLLSKFEIPDPKNITIEDLNYERIELEIVSIETFYKPKDFYTFVLGDAKTNLLLEVVVGKFEAYMLWIACANEKMDRPFPHELTLKIICELGYSIKEIVIYSTLNGIYRGKIVISDSYNYIEFESRTSDAVILAVLSKSPIYINKSIFDLNAVEKITPPIED